MVLDAHLGKYSSYDNMTQPTIIALLRDYSLKYVKFLQIVIGARVHQDNCMLWAQELVFVFNLLITTRQELFMFETLLDRMEADGLGCLCVHLAPFILQHRVRVVTQGGLRILCGYL